MVLLLLPPPRFFLREKVKGGERDLVTELLGDRG
jgi:hypothetical protein